jgi:hypothetical protein
MKMLQSIKRFWWVALLLVAGAQPAFGFALLGPLANGGDSWQTATLGYGLAYTEYDEFPGAPVNLGDIGGPKNLGEGYRRNTPVIYYTYDANFLNYFGSNGAAACDSAFAIMNQAFTTNPMTGQFLTNGVDSYSAGLSEYSPESLSVNLQMQSLALTDLKSVTLHALVEQMGLAEPERYAWTLAERVLPAGGKCPVDEYYLVVQRNYAATNSPLNQLQYSPYVNDTLYTYYIVENCTGPNPLAYTVPYNAYPYADVFTAVAANNYDGLGIGGYYTGLTRDDVAGLRYLLTATNINMEDVAPGSLLFNITTNFNTGGEQFPPIGAVTVSAAGFYYFDGVNGYGDLAAFLAFARTNNQAALQAAYPGVVVSSVSSTSNVWVWDPTYSYSYSSLLHAPYGSPLYLTVTTNYNTGHWLNYYSYQFANVFTNHYYTNQARLITTTAGPPIGSPYGSPSTTTTTVVVTNQIGGDFFVLSPFYTNVCPLDIINSSPPLTVTTSNLLSGVNTNLVMTTNTVSVSNSVYLVTVFTNYSFLINPVTCAQSTPAPGLYEGVERVQFVRADYDSLIGQTFQPITNNYTMNLVAGSQATVQNFQRVVTVPDILLSAANDIAANTFDGTVTRNINFDQAHIGAGLAGPGTITPGTTITYNKVGSAFENGYPYTTLNTNAFVQESSQMPVVQWASFDGSTNDPVLYPNGTSIANLQSQILIQVSPPPPTLPDGTNRVAYPATTFTAVGGAFTPPYTWSLASGSQPLPTGLYWTNSAPGVPNDTLAGKPVNNPSGYPFDFTVQLTDYLGRSVNWNYTITIH